jgi:hypothetical protein
MQWPVQVKLIQKLIWDGDKKEPNEKIELRLSRAEKYGKYHKVKAIDDGNHPACGQFGLFASKKIPKNSWIIDYVGKVSTSESPTSNYILKFYGNYSIDAEFMGNESRMINDFRMIKERPNAQFLLYFDIESNSPKMGVFSMSNEIKKNEEICVTYGKGFWQARS